METTRDNRSRFGRPMDRSREGHMGGGQLFVLRREGDFERGLLSEKGHDDNYLVFRPSNLFMRVLGDDVLRLNETLFEFRGRAVEHVLLLEEDELKKRYGELGQRFERVRDRLQALTEYCNLGFDGLFKEALAVAEQWREVQPEEAGDGGSEAKPFGPRGPDAFESVRQRNVEEGVLTDSGREGGYVAFQSCPFYGRVIGEIVYTFNDALRRVEDRSSHYIAGGDVVSVREYYTGLMRGMKPLRRELADVIEFCGWQVG